MRLPRDINHPNIRFVGFLNFGATSVTGDQLCDQVAGPETEFTERRSWNYRVTSFCSFDLKIKGAVSIMKLPRDIVL